ncbi:MAG: hypothetical protein GY826_30340 [Fuerstiella sp.]|nr:hypothetical protein [Fuerstiella sp.]
MVLWLCVAAAIIVMHGCTGCLSNCRISVELQTEVAREFAALRRPSLHSSTAALQCRGVQHSAAGVDLRRPHEILPGVLARHSLNSSKPASLGVLFEKSKTQTNERK